MATTAVKSKIMKTTTTTSKAAKAAVPERRALDTGGRPAGLGKGGTVTVHGGTTTGYQRGCRCDERKAAATDAKRRARERKAAAEAEATTKAVKAKARRETRKATS
jgi:hypothetical protein